MAVATAAAATVVNAPVLAVPAASADACAATNLTAGLPRLLLPLING